MYLLIKILAFSAGHEKEAEKNKQTRVSLGDFFKK